MRPQRAARDEDLAEALVTAAGFDLILNLHRGFDFRVSTKMVGDGDFTEAARAAGELALQYGLDLVDGDVATLSEDLAHARNFLSGLLELPLDFKSFFDLMFEDKVIPYSQCAKQALLNLAGCTTTVR